jgi:uncharacterized protein YbaP (TraB family)
MKKILFLLLGTLCVSSLMAQSNKAKPQPKKPSSPATLTLPAGKKYPSLLWVITGNGLKKPSYLFGTMHVSNKLAFNLGDSFYNAIRSVEVVALETNPETWQDDYSRSMLMRNGYGEDRSLRFSRSNWNVPMQTMSITSFAIDSYEELAKASLALEPSMINGMLYRTYGGNSNDFEENTFLDMHIFQVGRKLGKRVSGVEDFEASEKLVAEAYRDASRDKNKKKKSYSYDGMMNNPKKVEDAYRDGDLDLLDSLQALSVESDAFQEKFLYKRNEIQANSIDSILKKSSLFVGVGAAHLPGKRGVIEMLRQMGYTVRPVIMNRRNSIQKEQIDKMRVEHAFQQQSSDDGFYKVSIPGKKFYQFTNMGGGIDVVQYADLVNGAYYMVTRVKTNSSLWGDEPSKVADKIDAALYENIPGRIIKKTPITKNGYPGFDILNRTRRGDMQRYQIFITPFEMIFFKISGNAEFVSSGTEATKFFNSISLKEYTPVSEWISYQPPTGGFSILMPHAPSMLHDKMWNNNRLEYAAMDKKDGNSYLVIKGNVHNYAYIEEDSFELNLMDESYQYSGYMEKQLSRKFTSFKGYPSLNCTYKHKDGSFSTVKYIIQGPNYYAVLARYKQDNPAVKKFMESFQITPNIYPAATLQTDTTMRFSVKSPVPLSKVDPKDAEMIRFMMDLNKDEEDTADEDKANYKTMLLGNDTLGEKIWITYSQLSRKAYNKDSLGFWKGMFGDNWNLDSSLLFKTNSTKPLPNGARQYDFSVTDTGSSRLLVTRLFYKDGHVFSFSSLTDTVTRKSTFLDAFYSSFAPNETLKSSSLLNKKNSEYISDLFSKDSSVAKRAAKQVFNMDLDSTDVPLVKNAINSLNWGVRNYMAVKEYLIKELGNLKDPTVEAYLTSLYWKVKDTSDLQQVILKALLSQKTKTSFQAFKDLMLQEPPIIESDDDNYNYSTYRRTNNRSVDIIVAAPETLRPYSYYNYRSNWLQLYDSLALTRTLFPDMLQFLNIDDFKNETLELMHVLADSGYLKGADYESYLSKLYLDGRQLLKKQIAMENKRNMQKMVRKDVSSLYNNNSDEEDEEESALDEGNSDVDQYSVLLLPFRSKHQGIQNYFTQLMTTQDRRLLYNSFILLLRNNQPVPDSLFTKFASLDRYRVELYTDLKDMKKLDKFPKAEKNQMAMVKSMLLEEIGNYKEPDTLVFLDTLPVKYKGQEGRVFFYKYKKMRDDDAWSLAVAGMQPMNSDSVDVLPSEFLQPEGRTLENDQPVDAQLKKVLKEMLITLHPCAEDFYEARRYAKFKSMLSEMVKGRRYQD